MSDVLPLHRPDDNVHDPMGSIVTEHFDPDKPDHFDGDADTSAKSLERLHAFATTPGDISHLLTAAELGELGEKAVNEWRRDDATRSDWKAKVEKALDEAAQEPREGRDFPFEGSSNVRSTLIVVAAEEFAARAYPAIIKGDEAAGVKLPPKPPTPDPVPPLPQGAQQDPKAVALFQQATAAANMLTQAGQTYTQLEARARRVKAWLNHRMFYGMDDWEGDMDAMLNQIPVTGKAFKKVYYDQQAGGACSELVSPLHVTMAMDTRSMLTCPRITHDFEVYPYEIQQRMRSGQYRYVELDTKAENDQAPRQLIEQHRMHDLDGDGFPEPWIVTVDVASQEVLRVEAAFDARDLTLDPEKKRVTHIKRWNPWVGFDFLPDPKGRAYALGFGVLLSDTTEVIEEMTNQIINAGKAQIAGGGFIASGLRLQGAGQSSTMRWRLGEFKVVNAPPGQLQQSIWERTLPNTGPAAMQLLEMMTNDAKAVANVKDILTGDTPATAPVGTTMAVASQALQGFSAIFKRIYRSLKYEFGLIYECEARWGNVSDEEYARVTGDPSGKFKDDFEEGGAADIEPVADPQVVTKAQALGKAQGLLQVASSPLAEKAGMDPKKVLTDVISALDYSDPASYFAPPPPPDPLVLQEKQANIGKIQSETTLNRARAVSQVGAHALSVAEAEEVQHDTQRKNHLTIQTLAAGARDERGDAGVGAAPGDGMGAGSLGAPS